MDGKAESSSRQRTSNFTEEEVRCLLELVKERAEALFSKLNNSVTVKRKQTLWEDIATRVNARGKTQRPTQKVKKKWSDLRLNAIRLRSKLKTRPTGGGPPPEIPWWHDIVLDILNLGVETCLLEGIKEEKESDDPKADFAEVDVAEVGFVENAWRRDLSPDDSFESSNVEDRRTPASVPLDDTEGVPVNRAATAACVSPASTPSATASITRTEDAPLVDLNKRKSAHSGLQSVLAVKKRRMEQEAKKSTNDLGHELTETEIGRKQIEKDKLKVQIKKMKIEMKKARMEMELIGQKMTLTKHLTTNAKLEQANLLYAMRKTERENGWPSAVIDLDISLPHEHSI